MKKFLVLASGAALALASCSDDLGLKNTNQDQGLTIEGKSVITATMPLNQDADTRTSMEYNGSSYTYYWETGDAIGVFGESDQYFYNEPFVYANPQPAVSGQFAGQVELTSGSLYYAYYPYDPYNQQVLTQTSGKNVLNLNINGTQTFNQDAAKEPWSDDYANGCFTNYAAPAVAWSYAGSNNELALNFQPVASYLVLPVCGYDMPAVNQVELQITNGTSTSYQYLWGQIQVPVEAYTEGTPLTNLPVQQNSTAQQTLKLNFTKPLQLSATQPVNLWFVVPATTQLAGSTISLTFNVQGDSKTYSTSYTIPSNFQANNPTKQVMGRNQVRWIWPNPATDTPFYVVNSDSYVIQTQEQFLEYANLVTSGYNNAWGAYSSSNFKGYSDLPNMISKDGNYAKPALVVKDITLNAEEIMSYLGISNMTQLSKLGDYFVDVYGQFLSEGSIKAIGGANVVTLAGAYDETVENAPLISINNLKVEGNNLFNPCQYGISTLSNIAFNNVTVDASDETGTTFQFFNPSSFVYDNVVVNSTCEVVPAEVKDAETGIFGTLTTTYINGGKKNVVNKTEMPFAVNLNVDSDFSFVKNPVNATPADFTNISIVPNDTQMNGFGAILTVADGAANAVSLMSRVINPKAVVYSVVDSSTSYWTGTSNTADWAVGFLKTNKPGTAELLASLVQTGADQAYTLTRNLDLMGNQTTALGNKFNQYWIGAADPYTGVMTVNGKSNNKTYSISNVLINGAKSKTPVLTMFGWQSVVNDLTVNGLTINNTGTGAKTNVLAAALSGGPVGASKNNTVTGYYINTASAAGGVVGGLYYSLNQNISSISSASISWSSEQPTLTKIDGGNLAGYFEYTTSSTPGYTNTIDSPMTGVANLFGNYQIKVTETNGGTLIKLNGFTTDFVKLANFVPATDAGLSKNYQLSLIIGSSKTVYYWNPNLNGAGKGGFQADPVPNN